MNKEIFIVLFLQIFVSIRTKVLLLSKKGLSLDKNSELNSIEIFPDNIEVGFNNLWIHFIFREFEYFLQMESWARCLGGCMILFFFTISFLIYFGIVYIWPMYHSLDKRIWFTIIFLPLKESLTIPDTDSILPSLILSQLELSGIEVPKFYRHQWKWEVPQPL